MAFLDKLRQRGSLNLPVPISVPTQSTDIQNQNPYAPQQVPVEQEPAVLDANTIAEKIDPLLGVVEHVTGLQRREIFLHLLKAGVKGNGISGFLEGLLGQKPPAEAKFIRYTKTIVIWGLVAIFFGGLVLITLVAYAHFMTKLMGV